MNKPSRKKYLSIELTTTQMCNFHCDYCFENNYTVADDNLVSKKSEEVIKSIEKIYTSDFFKDKFGFGQISFWGGEPSLNFKLIKKVVDYFKTWENIGFFIYTNGSKIEKMLPFLKEVKNMKVGDHHKFQIQISYDGQPVHDMRRRTKDGFGSSSIALQAMEVLEKNGIKFGLKATLQQKDFKFLPEIWDDYKQLYDKYGKFIRYSLTSDYENPEVYKYFQMMEESLVEIAKKEYHFFKENGHFLSNLFNGSKRFCSAGKNLFTIDIDGNIYLCHGCLYSQCKNDFQLGHIFDRDIIKKLENSYNKFYHTEIQSKECENCVAMLCIRCNTRKYKSSKKEDFLDRWRDYTSQQDLCDFYKMLGRIGRALIEILKEEKLWDAHSNVPETMPVQQIQTVQDINQHVEVI